MQNLSCISINPYLFLSLFSVSVLFFLSFLDPSKDRKKKMKRMKMTSIRISRQRNIRRRRPLSFSPLHLRFYLCSSVRSFPDEASRRHEKSTGAREENEEEKREEEEERKKKLGWSNLKRHHLVKHEAHAKNICRVNLFLPSVPPKNNMRRVKEKKKSGLYNRTSHFLTSFLVPLEGDWLSCHVQRQRDFRQRFKHNKCIVNFKSYFPLKKSQKRKKKGRRRKRQEQVEDPEEERETSFSHFYLNILLPMTVLLLSLNGMSNKKRS